MNRIHPYCTILLLALCLQGLNAQSSKISKEAWRQQAMPYLDSAKALIETNPTEAFDYALLAINVAIDKNDPRAEAEAYLIIGQINQQVEQYDLALDNYNKALTLFIDLKDRSKVNQTKEYLASVYDLRGELDKGEAVLKELANEAEQESQNSLMRSSKRSLAKVYKKRGEPEKAIRELEDVKKLDIQEGNVQEQLATNRQLIDAYADENPSQALELSLENESIANTIRDTSMILDALQQKAEIYGNLGQQEEQISTLQQSLDLNQKKEDVQGQSEANLAISEVLMQQNRIADAIGYLEESIEQSEQIGNVEIQKRALKSLSKAYDQTGDYNRALAVYRAYVDASERSAQERERKILENLELMQSLTRRLERIDMLENQRLLNYQTIELMEREQEVAKKSLRQMRMIVISLTVGLLLLSAAIYLVYRSSRQKRIANQLLALRSLRSQMNPHFIFNALNSVNSFISKSDERSANKYLSDFSKLMRAVMENSKHDFVSLASEVQILELYLKLEHHRFIEKFDYSFEVEKDIDQENIQVPPMLIQPYIENAVWHGLRYKEDKGYLKVAIQNGDHLKVLVEDNGIGRQKSMELKTKNQQQSNSTGLSNINKRLEIINQVHGTDLKVSVEDLDQATQSGTRVTIDIMQK